MSRTQTQDIREPKKRAQADPAGGTVGQELVVLGLLTTRETLPLSPALVTDAEGHQEWAEGNH